MYIFVIIKQFTLPVEVLYHFQPKTDTPAIGVSNDMANDVVHVYFASSFS